MVTSSETIEAMLTGGHHNSLGRTEEVAQLVIDHPERMAELFDSYKSDNDVVRMRVSSALKRIEPVRRDLIMAYLDRLIDETGQLDQPSAQWTLADLFGRVRDEMSAGQFERARAVLKRNLAHNPDWIVINLTIETLSDWAADDPALAAWMRPHLERHAKDSRKSVAKRAHKALERL